MLHATIILGIACTMASTLMASPVDPSLQERNLNSSASVELFREPSGPGHIAYFGHSDGETDEAGVDKRRIRCDANSRPSLQCDTKHGARNDDCFQLVSDLEANPQAIIPDSAHELCYLGPAAKNFVCCIMWSKHKVKGLVKGDLIGHAEWMMDTCTLNGISGKVFGGHLGGQCTNVCLSAYEGHCHG